MSRGNCHAVGCSVWGLNGKAFCDRHWAMLESDLQRIIARTFKPHAKKPSERFLVALKQSQREILFYQTNGYRIPRDQPFRWDDPPEVRHGTD
jgi:hypothetical protein